MNSESASGFYQNKHSAHEEVCEQQVLFGEEPFLPVSPLRTSDLRPASSLAAVFEECHNYIYANEGWLKDKLFREMVKLLMMKLHDEHSAGNGCLQFYVTSSEYEALQHDLPCGFVARMAQLYQSVREKYPSLLSEDSLYLKPLTLAFVVARLQNISLLQTPADVKGEAFQSFVSRYQRGDRGEFFTPHPIVRLAVEMIDPQTHEKVLDPACGSGGFLIQTISWVSPKLPDTSRETYIAQNIRGIEFNPDVATSAMLRIAFEGGTGWEILCANALEEHEHLDGQFDVVLTNPPFGSKGKVEDKRLLKAFALAHRWVRLSDEQWHQTGELLAGQTPEVLFIERCLKFLKPGGRLAIVLPDGLLQNVSNSHIRYWLRSQCKVLGVVSIPQEAFVPYGTGIKTSLLLLQKLPADANKVFMARVRKIGYDVKGQPVYKRDEHGRLVRSPSGAPVVDSDIDEVADAYRRFKQEGIEPRSADMYTVPTHQLNLRLDAEHYAPSDIEMIEHLRAQGAKPLGEIATIVTETDDFRDSPNVDIHYIAISDVDARSMQVVSMQVMKAHDAPSRATYRVRAGDIITATSGASTGTPRHATAFITDEEDGAICSNGFAVLRDFRGVEPLYLLAYMRTGYFLRQVRRLITGHAIPAISLEDLAKVLVLVPPIEVQSKIASRMREILKMRKEAIRAADLLVEEVEHIAQSPTVDTCEPALV